MILANIADSMPQTFRFALLGDAHVGNVGTSEHAIQKAVEIIKSDRRCYWGMLGDATESIHVGDKRYDPVIHEGRYALAQAQAEGFCELFGGIQKRIKFLIAGNHERKIRHFVDVPKLIWKEWGEPDIAWGLDKSIKIKLQDHCRLYCHHGFGSVNSRAEDEDRREFNDGDSIRKKLMNKAGDCHGMFMAHIHKMRIRKPSPKLAIVGDSELQEIYPSGVETPEGYIPQQFRWYGSTGAFLRTTVIGKTTYSEDFGYDPVELGFLMCYIEKGHLVNVEKVLL